MDSLDEQIRRVEDKIADVKKRWPFHSAKSALFQELEDLEEELAALKKRRKE